MVYFGKTFILLFVVFVLIEALPKQIELFTEPNQSGNFVTLTEKIPDLKDWKFFLNSVKSYCAIGFWNFYTLINYATNGTNYDHEAFTGSGDGYEIPYCSNHDDFKKFNSARYMGPRDTRTAAIGIYEGSATSAFSFEEVVVTSRAQTNFPMNQTTSIVLFGNSNWTVFNENNFQGNSSRVDSLGFLFTYIPLNMTFNVRSVLMEEN
jgi:hypothetical protein